MNGILLKCFLATAMVGASVSVAGADEHRSKLLEPDEHPQALMIDEIRLRETVSGALAQIRSKDNLDSHLAVAHIINSPILYLSDKARTRFLESLEFSENGLASFDYRDLQRELTASQIYEVLSLFGMQKTIRSIPHLRVASDLDKAVIDAAYLPLSCNTPGPVLPGAGGFCDDDHWHNYVCRSPGTCSGRNGSICTSNC